MREIIFVVGPNVGAALAVNTYAVFWFDEKVQNLGFEL
jgi:hypothetical protein